MSTLLLARARGRRGFTLIEILIAVLVLALGLLGLGAVFPVVVRQQRQASDTVKGITALRSAEAFILSHGRGMLRDEVPSSNDLGWLNEPSGIAAPWTRGAVGRAQARGWDIWLADVDSVSTDPTGGSAQPELGRKGWSLPTTRWERPNYDEVTGELRIRPRTGNGPLRVVIPVAQRLFPAPDTAGQQPEYVWDFVGRRVVGGAWGSQSVQLAVFVRRIDSGIQVPPGRTLSDVLQGRRMPPMARPVRPVASRPVAGSDKYGTGAPTFNGVGDYSTIMTAEFVFSGPSRITIQDSTPEQRRALRQVGQKLVDSRGNVYTVVRLEDRGTDLNDSVYIDGVVSSAEMTQSQTPVGGVSRPFNIAFTPQIPAAVSVVTIKR